MKDPAVAIVGATGAVGQVLLDQIEARSFPHRKLVPVASARSTGRTVRGQPVHDLNDFDFDGVDLAFFSAGTAVSREHVRRAAEKGAVVIDNTNAFRMEQDTPLVVPQVNGSQLSAPSSIIANPNCSTIPVVRVVHALSAVHRVKRFVASTYQAASGAGLSGIQELKDDSLQRLHGADGFGHRFPKPGLAFNVIPFIGSLVENGFTDEERKMLLESRKILDRADLLVSATTVRVPVISGHSASVYFECDGPIDVDAITEQLAAAPEVTVYRGDHYPMPRDLAEPDRVHVGRLRQDPCAPSCGWCWVVSDNLWVGAALNAIQIAERIVEEGWLSCSRC